MQEFLQQPERQYDITRIQGSWTRRTEHPTPEEIEEIDSKWNVMKIIEELKQEVKICHKEMEEKYSKKIEEISKEMEETYNKKFEEMSKSVNETLGNKEKQSNR